MDTDRIGSHRGELARTVVTGPLAPYARGWRAELPRRAHLSTSHQHGSTTHGMSGRSAYGPKPASHR